jgi:Cu+-exporting ATPase
MNAQLTIPVKGMHCASCAMTIEKTLKNAAGVTSCEVNYGNEKAKLDFDPNVTNISELSKKIEPFGYSLRQDSEVKADHSEHSTHTMPDGSEMMDHDMHAEGMDHSAHLGLNQSKEEKLNELAEQRKKVEFVMPITIGIFALMMWEIAAETFTWVPMFFLPHELFRIISLILATLVLFWIGIGFLKEVVVFAKYRVANMYTLIGIGTLTAYIYSTIVVLFPPIRELLQLPETVYFDVVIVVIGFVYLGKYLETRSKLRTGEAIEKLLNLQAKTALVERDGKEVRIPVEQVKVNDLIIVKPGGKIPVDGTIVEGQSTIDESMITGESMPVDKKIDDLVIGGTINKQGAFKFKTSKVGSETLLAQIIRMVDEAQGSKAPIQGLADRISAVFVPAVLTLAVVTLLVWLILGSQFMPFTEALSIGLLCFVGILVIACPCALGLATPTAIIVGTGKGAENGILIKNAESLEKLHKVNTVVTDKTGTITKGEPEVTDINVFAEEPGAIEVDEALKLLASLENNSEHPIAKAIMSKALAEEVKLYKVDGFENIEGKGLKGTINGKEYYAGNLTLLEDLNVPFTSSLITEFTDQGKTPVVLTDGTDVLAIAAVADTLKENAKETVKQLHKLGIRVVMLTGDNERTANYIAGLVGIDEVIAEVLPHEKAERIKYLQSRGNIVAMLGDGVNDAPALTQADIGIAMGTGTDVAIESAEITLLKGDFSKVLQAIKLSKFTMRAIKQNLFWAFAYNIVGIPLAAGLLYPFFGILLNPIFAGLAMALSSVSVVGNSLRLKSTKL